MHLVLCFLQLREGPLHSRPIADLVIGLHNCALFVLSQTPRDLILQATIEIVKTNFTRNRLDPMRRGLCNQSNGNTDPSWGGAIFMGSTRSINPDSANFTLEKGSLSCVLETVVFEQNAADNGGAIAFVRASLLQMDDVHFVQNKGGDGGAIFLELDGDPHPQVGFAPIHYVNGGNLLFQDNLANRGGALFSRVRCGTGLALVGISPYNITRVALNEIVNNEDAIFFETTNFIQNHATESGGAWHVDKGRVGCLSCTFLDNTVEGGFETGGGAIAIENEAALHARNVTLKQNTAEHGGAIYAQNSLVDIVESKFIANAAKEHGGGLYMRATANVRFRLGSVGVVENSTFDRNVATVGGGYTCVCINLFIYPSIVNLYTYLCFFY